MVKDILLKADEKISCKRKAKVFTWQEKRKGPLDSGEECLAREKLAHDFEQLPNIDPRRELKLDLKFCRKTAFDVFYGPCLSCLYFSLSFFINRQPIASHYHRN